jgi:hypothetical protein
MFVTLKCWRNSVILETESEFSWPNVTSHQLAVIEHVIHLKLLVNRWTSVSHFIGKKSIATYMIQYDMMATCMIQYDMMATYMIQYGMIATYMIRYDIIATYMSTWLNSNRTDLQFDVLSSLPNFTGSTHTKDEKCIRSFGRITWREESIWLT